MANEKECWNETIQRIRKKNHTERSVLKLKERQRKMEENRKTRAGTILTYIYTQLFLNLPSAQWIKKLFRLFILASDALRKISSPNSNKYVYIHREAKIGMRWWKSDATELLNIPRVWNIST